MNQNLNLTEEQTKALVDSLKAAKQGDVVDVLKSYGFAWSRGRKAGSETGVGFSAADKAIVETLAKYADGLKAGVLRFFVCEQGDAKLTGLQFTSRVAGLVKDGSIHSPERGRYKVGPMPSSEATDTESEAKAE